MHSNLTRQQTAQLLGTSDDLVDSLLRKRLLVRYQPDNIFVFICIESLARYAHLPVEYLADELQRLPGDKGLNLEGNHDCRSSGPFENPQPFSSAIRDYMTLSASKYQASIILGVCRNTVDNLLHQGLLQRTKGNRHVEITFQSISNYSKLPLEWVIREFRFIPRRPSGIANDQG